MLLEQKPGGIVSETLDVEYLMQFFIGDQNEKQVVYEHKTKADEQLLMNDD